MRLTGVLRFLQGNRERKGVVAKTPLTYPLYAIYQLTETYTFLLRKVFLTAKPMKQLIQKCGERDLRVSAFRFCKVVSRKGLRGRRIHILMGTLG